MEHAHIHVSQTVTVCFINKHLTNDKNYKNLIVVLLLFKLNKHLYTEIQTFSHKYTESISFLTLLTDSRLCRPERRLMRGAHEFYQWVSIPDGRFRLQWKELSNLWTAWRHYVSRRAMRLMRGSAWFVSSRQQWQSLSSVIRHDAVYFRTSCISVEYLHEIRTC
jgi:hypothetical protein